MHVLIGLIAIIGAVAFWLWRVRAAAEASNEIVDAASDARAALRRYGYRRKAGQHPTESVDDPRLAAAAILAAVAKMDGDLTADQFNALRVECRASFRVDQGEADDMAAYGRWLADQCKSPDDAIRRLAKIVRDRAPKEAHGDMIRMMERVASVQGGAPSSLQKDAIEMVKRTLVPA